jgi:hypothetical protein
MSDLSNNRPADKLVLCESYSDVDGIHDCLYCYVSPIFQYRQCGVDTGSDTWDGSYSYEHDPTPFPMKIQDLYINRNCLYSGVRDEGALKQVLEYGLFDAMKLRSRLQGCYPNVQWPNCLPTNFHFCCLHWILGRFKSYISSHWRYRPIETFSSPLSHSLNVKSSETSSPFVPQAQQSSVQLLQPNRPRDLILVNLDNYQSLTPYLKEVFKIAGEFNEDLGDGIKEILSLPNLDAYESEPEFNQRRSYLQQKIEGFEKQLQSIASDQGIFPQLYPKVSQTESGLTEQTVVVKKTEDLAPRLSSDIALKSVDNDLNAPDQPPGELLKLAESWLCFLRCNDGPTIDQREFMKSIINGGGKRQPADIKQDMGKGWEDLDRSCRDHVRRINEKVKNLGWKLHWDRSEIHIVRSPSEISEIG